MNRSSIFTFQYASIKPMPIFAATRDSPAFTFQYASIKPQIVKGLKAQRTYLHFNMLLLNPTGAT